MRRHLFGHVGIYINERRPFAPMRKTLRVGNVQATKISSHPSCATVSDFLILQLRLLFIISLLYVYIALKKDKKS